ncbi:unnamed protein product [Spirodela intermedia]|uniref:Gnk2-homologous domain-containing protein n=1 Tax=Spirodela intermedia TaxID=51605 RepID=A0A7I8JF24_SPIIN|nr:unnamed protein product [Spirodela intermedia]CAA6668750.1 unnamed protein product [Spirodela intermedia]
MASLLLLWSLILMMGSLFLGSAAGEPIYSLCNTNRNYTSNSTYQANLGRLISSLSSSAPATGFANDTAGEVPDRVYGLATCRGDVAASRCRDCLAGVARDAAAGCPGNKGATIFYELCHLRYSDQNFFGSSTGSEYFQWNTVNVSDVPTFNRLLGGLLNNLTTRAASLEMRFATGMVDFTVFQKIYALVQCTRDLAPETCDTCLRIEIGDIPGCCEARNGASVLGGSCYLRYDVVPFFNAFVAADPPPPRPPSVPANTSPPAAGTPLLEVKAKLFSIFFRLASSRTFKGTSESSDLDMSSAGGQLCARECERLGYGGEGEARRISPGCFLL